jgi:Tfp pilus assembly protein PilX
MNTPSLRSLRRGQSGSAVLAALAILVVTLIAVSAVLFEASHRFRTSHQSSRWSQAGQAAEAGAEIALMSAQRGSWIADGWSADPGASPAPVPPVPATKTIALNAGVPATGPVNTSVSVDEINMGGNQWLRIRSTGTAAVSGGAQEGIDPRDVTLRKLSLRRDRNSGAALTAPQATRTVEVLAIPRSDFLSALLLDKKFNMSGGGWVDSFDSSDSAKSTLGLYDVAKRQSNGDVGVNDTQGASDLKSTYVYGDVAYSGPDYFVTHPEIQNTTNVQGDVTTPFSKPVAPVPAPGGSWNPTPTIINNTTTLFGGSSPSTPARYKVSSLTVSGGKVLTLAPYAPDVESYIDIYVTGNFTTSGSGYVLQQPGVHVTYYIQGDLTVSGSSFNNRTNIAANNMINVVSPPKGTTQKVTVSGGGTFIGTINAPGADFTISGSANFSGALIGKTMVISGGASVHYDEALAKLPGNGYGYNVASWVEAVR